MKLAHLAPLADALPGVHLVRVDRQDLGVGMAEKVAAELLRGAAQAMSLQQEGRLDCATGNDCDRSAQLDLDVAAAVFRVHGAAGSTNAATVLDQQALEMMTQAARVTSLPPSLKGRDFRVLLPVKFSLEGDQ